MCDKIKNKLRYLVRCSPSHANFKEYMSSIFLYFLWKKFLFHFIKRIFFHKKSWSVRVNFSTYFNLYFNLLHKFLFYFFIIYHFLYYYQPWTQPYYTKLLAGNNMFLCVRGQWQVWLSLQVYNCPSGKESCGNSGETHQGKS